VTESGDGEIRVHAAERHLSVGVPVEQLLLVVAANDHRAGAPRQVEHAERVRSARDEVADEHQTVPRAEVHAIEKRLQLERASVHVADDDRSPEGMRAHGLCVIRRLQFIRPVVTSDRESRGKWRVEALSSRGTDLGVWVVTPITTTSRQDPAAIEAS